MSTPTNRLYGLLATTRHLINTTHLEVLCKLPKKSLAKHYVWCDGKPDGKRLPMKHGPAIVRGLCGVFGGIKIDGRIVTLWNDGKYFALQKPFIPVTFTTFAYVNIFTQDNGFMMLGESHMAAFLAGDAATTDKILKK